MPARFGIRSTGMSNKQWDEETQLRELDVL
jgi:hypothetical protein